MFLNEIDRIIFFAKNKMFCKSNGKDKKKKNTVIVIFAKKKRKQNRPLEVAINRYIRQINIYIYNN